jgi:hypothetical protein
MLIRGGTPFRGLKSQQRNVDFTSARTLADEKGTARRCLLRVSTIEVKARGFTLTKPARITLNVVRASGGHVRMVSRRSLKA